MPPPQTSVSQPQWPQSLPWSSAIWSIHSLRVLYMPTFFFPNPLTKILSILQDTWQIWTFPRPSWLAVRNILFLIWAFFFPLKELISYCLIIICKLNEKSPQSECRLQEVKEDIIYVFLSHSKTLFITFERLNEFYLSKQSGDYQFLCHLKKGTFCLPN